MYVCWGANREQSYDFVQSISYELDPEDIIYSGYYRHENQEEVFYVQHGTVTFETEEANVETGPGDVVRFAPGEWKGGTNTGAGRAIVLAIGAPPDRGRRRSCANAPSVATARPKRSK